MRFTAGWPYLHEAKVISISDEYFKYGISRVGSRIDITKTPHDEYDLQAWFKASETTENTYSKRYGALIGHPDILCRVRPLKGKLQILYLRNAIKSRWFCR